MKILNMKKKLTLWIVFLPFVLWAQQTEFKDGALTIDFAKKKKIQADTTKTQSNSDEETSPKPKKQKQGYVEEAEEFNPKRDGLFKATFAAGLNLSQIDGDDQAGYNYPGAQAAVGVLVKFHKNVSVGFEIQYAMKGAFKRVSSNGVPLSIFRQQWDFVGIPLMLNVHDKKLVMASAGLSFNYLVRNKLRLDIYDTKGDIDELKSTEARIRWNIEPRKFDLCAVVGFQFLIKKVLGIGARFEYSLIGLKPSLGPATKVRNMYNNTVTIRLQYILSPVKKK